MTSLSEQELAYVAGILDSQGCISVRTTNDGTELPQVSVSGPNVAMLTYLGEITGVRPVITSRNYTKAGCSEHCAEKHVHVISTSGRWLVSGVKATVVLAACRPYLRWKGTEADAVVDLGLSSPFKAATPGKMRALGWPLPDPWA